MKRKLSASSMMNRLVKLAFDNINYFRDNPKHLAWVMAHFQILSRKAGENPKYFILDYETSQEDIDFVYSAWSITVSHMRICIDPIHHKYHKKEMSFDELVDMIMDKGYRYHGLHKTRESVANYLFMVIGSGYDWHEGYITPLETGGYPSWLFIGYTECEQEVKQSIRDRVYEIINCNKDIADYISTTWEEIHFYNKADIATQYELDMPDSIRKFRAANKEDKDLLLKHSDSIEQKELVKNEQPPNYYPWAEEYSNICLIPENAEDSFVRGAKNILQQIKNKECTISDKEPRDRDILLAQKILFQLEKSHPHIG